MSSNIQKIDSLRTSELREGPFVKPKVATSPKDPGDLRQMVFSRSSLATRDASLL